MRKRLSGLACIVMLLAVTVAFIACMGPEKQQRLKTSQIKTPVQYQIVGVTTLKGEEVQFDPATGFYSQGSVGGKVKGADFKIPFGEVDRLWVMRRTVSKARTVALVVGISAAAAAAVAGIVVGILAASDSARGSMGCPLVYAWDGAQFVFDAELYGGAISQGLERPDYSELPHLRAEGGAYRVLLNDELEETDYTDSLELWAVDHPAGTHAGVDSLGKLHSLGDLRPPLEARDETGADLLPWLEAPDRRIWEGPPAKLPGGRLRHDIVMSFAKPPASRTAKLLIHSGSGAWAIQMLSTLYELYGRDYLRTHPRRRRNIRSSGGCRAAAPGPGIPVDRR